MGTIFQALLFRDCQNHTGRDSKGEVPEFHRIRDAGQGRHKYCKDCSAVGRRLQNRTYQADLYRQNPSSRVERLIVQKALESIGLRRRDVVATMFGGLVNVLGASETARHEQAFKTVGEIHGLVRLGLETAANKAALGLKAFIVDDKSLFANRVRIWCDGIRCDTGEPQLSPEVIKEWFALTTQRHDRLTFVHALLRETNRLRMLNRYEEAREHIAAAKAFLEYRCRRDEQETRAELHHEAEMLEFKVTWFNKRRNRDLADLQLRTMCTLMTENPSSLVCNVETFRELIGYNTMLHKADTAERWLQQAQPWFKRLTNFAPSVRLGILRPEIELRYEQGNESAGADRLREYETLVALQPNPFHQKTLRELKHKYLGVEPVGRIAMDGANPSLIAFYCSDTFINTL